MGSKIAVVVAAENGLVDGLLFVPASRFNIILELAETVNFFGPTKIQLSEC